MAREINLVPEVKYEMIKALKLRNFILFVCIVVASAGAGLIVLFALIASGQQAVVNGKKDTIDAMSNKISSYSNLNEFLTIRDQLGNLSSISDQKQVLSRSFNVLAALIPTGPDTITISELNINLANDEPTFSFDAQADANSEPYIDYGVLDSFKKSMEFMKYDYGNYIDREGETIPAYCIIENNDDGSILRDATRGYYAYWTINAENCNPSNSTETLEEFAGQSVVRIWRTPQYDEWYKAEQIENQPYMSLSGDIQNVPHFESECTTYSGTQGSDGKIAWDSSNSCSLVPQSADGDDETEGITISDSSNGRGVNDSLVLRFSAVIRLSPDTFKFENKHMIAIPPSGRFNVTDSYVQVQKMFAERASDCTDTDTECKTSTGGN